MVHNLSDFSHDEALYSCQEPLRSAVIDPCIRVADNGRESIHRKV